MEFVASGNSKVKTLEISKKNKLPSMIIILDDFDGSAV
jgi:hypothetical protein